MVLVPYLFWRGTWFGRPLTDGEIDRFLQQSSNPRRTQHALVQISERIMRGEKTVCRWYPAVEQVSLKSEPEVRAMAAWLMGQDNQYASFHRRLSALLQDSEPMVRRNAALALVRFGDRQGKSEIQAMLRPFLLKASRAGTLDFPAENWRFGQHWNPDSPNSGCQSRPG